MSDVVQIKTSEVLAQLKAGKTRAEIGEMYSLNGVQVKDLFKNPKLKNKKTVKEKGVAFILIDDTEDAPVVETVAATAVTETVTDQVNSPVKTVAETETSTEVVEEQVVEEVTATAVEEVAETVVEKAGEERSLWEND